MLRKRVIGAARWWKLGCGLALAGWVTLPGGEAYGQQNRRQPGRLAGSQGKENTKPEKQKEDEPEKVNGSSVEALNIYADAANFQNNRAFE
jgi:hypothetical protein